MSQKGLRGKWPEERDLEGGWGGEAQKAWEVSPGPRRRAEEPEERETDLKRKRWQRGRRGEKEKDLAGVPGWLS